MSFIASLRHRCASIPVPEGTVKWIARVCTSIEAIMLFSACIADVAANFHGYKLMQFAFLVMISMWLVVIEFTVPPILMNQFKFMSHFAGRGIVALLYVLSPKCLALPIVALVAWLRSGVVRSKKKTENKKN
jgi:DNA integrity scanning protein DisA with diadenylate cyclase activity